MTPFYSVDVSNQLGIYELEQYSIIRMLSKCFWVAGSLQEGGGSVRDTDPLAADHCSSCVATEMELMFTLDPSTCKMEYSGDPKYDGCCFYIGTPQKKEFYLCATNTPVAARAWVATLT
ncbi:unnamed protein product [Sphagnum troendelagicum]